MEEKDSNNLYFKNNLWQYLLSAKNRAEVTAKRHEKMKSLLGYFKIALEIGISGAATLVTVISGMDLYSENSHGVVIMSLSGVSIASKIIEKACSLDESILHHDRSTQSYKFLAEYIDRVVLLKTTQNQFIEQVDIISNLFNTFEQNAPKVPGWLESRYKINKEDTNPKMPRSLSNSESSHSSDLSLLV